MFTSSTIHGPAGLKGLDGLAAFGSLAMLPTAFTARFGRVARSYPAMPRRRPLPGLAMSSRMPSPLSSPMSSTVSSPMSPMRAVRHEGLAVAAARLFARVLARLAQAAEQRGQQWARARERRRTELALRQLDGHTLRDIGLTEGEISSVSAEAAGQVEATRVRAWREVNTFVS
jgi:uncharacterized protein YjiS (DUF1127 family)